MRRVVACLVVVAALSLATEAAGQTVVNTIYGVRATVATSAQEQPNIKLGEWQWFILNQGFWGQACLLYVYPYGTAIPNGFIEFPGDWTNASTLAGKCLGAPEGSCIEMDVDVLDQPDMWGATYRAKSFASCW